MENEEGSWWSRVCRGKKPPKTATTVTAASSPDKIPAEENAKVDLDGLLRHITRLFQLREGKIAAYEPVAGQQFWPSSQRFINLNTFLYDGRKANKNNTLVDSKAIARTLLQGMGSGSMVALGLLVVANILERFEDVSTNQIECLDLLKEMLKLGKLVKEFKELKGDMHNEIEVATALIVEGSIMCCAHINSPNFSQFFRAGIDKENIDQIKKELDTMYRDLHTKMLINLHRKLDDQPGHPAYFPASQPPQLQAQAPVIIYADKVFLPAGGLLPTGSQEHEEQDKRKAEEEAKSAEEKRKAEEEAKRAEEKRKAEQDKRKAEEEARRAGEKRKAEEDKRKAEKEARRAEEKRKAEEDKRKAEEEARRAEDGYLRKPEPAPARLPVTIHHADNVDFFLNAGDLRKPEPAPRGYLLQFVMKITLTFFLMQVLKRGEAHSTRTQHRNTELKTCIYSSINRYIYKLEKFLEMDSGGGFLEKLANFPRFLESAFKSLLNIGSE